MKVLSNLDFGDGSKIINLPDPIDAGDAVNKNWVQNAFLSSGFGNWPGSINATAVGDSTLFNSFVQFPTTNSRSDGNLTLGFTFLPADFITVSQLGRFYINTDTQDHPIGLWEKATGILVASGVILFSSPSDANNMKYVSIPLVVLSPAKEYILASFEMGGGDTWRDSWDSTDYFSPFIKRTGYGYAAGVSLVRPDTFSSGVDIYNTLNLKFTTESTPQIRALYDSNNYMAMLARSNGTGIFLNSNPDKLISVLNPLVIGGGSLASTYQFGVSGNSFFRSTNPISTNNGSVGVGEFLNFGASSGIGRNGVFVRDGYVLIESGAGNGKQILLNYDNPAGNVTIGGIGNGKFNIYNDSASKVVLNLIGANGQSANFASIFSSSGSILSIIAKADGSYQPTTLIDTSATNNSVYFSSTTSRFTYKNSGGFLNSFSGINTGDQSSIAGITGTTSQFNTALTDGDFCTLAGTETLSNKVLIRKLSTKTSSYTLSNADDYVRFDGVALVATLPDAIALSGYQFKIKNLNASVLRVNTTSSQLMDSNLIIYLSRYEVLDVISNGVNWDII